jgi:hypothetical protein
MQLRRAADGAAPSSGQDVLRTGEVQAVGEAAAVVFEDVVEVAAPGGA